MSFKLGAVLENDSTFVADLSLSQIRIVNNANFPWVLVIPRLTGIVEITDLSDDQYRMLNAEIRLIAKIMQIVFEPDKLNIATLGNKVRQMHYHIVARYETDACFPDPVWGYETAIYDQEQLQLHIDNIRKLLGFKD